MYDFGDFGEFGRDVLLYITEGDIVDAEVLVFDFLCMVLFRYDSNTLSHVSVTWLKSVVEVPSLEHLQKCN